MTEAQAESLELAVVPASESRAVLTLVTNPANALEQLKELHQFVKTYLIEGDDYGVIPGTNKPTLYKPGADKLKEVYGLYSDIQMVQRTEKWELTPPLFDYEFKVLLKRRFDDSIVATGVGSCNSWESRYRYRKSERVCPNPDCGKETIIKGQAQYGGGWLCWQKKGGCGAKFKDGDPAIESQVVGKAENTDLADVKNTVLKMAKKRADIDAVISATRSSHLFTQDLGADAADPERFQEAPKPMEGGGYASKEDAQKAAAAKKPKSASTAQNAPTAQSQKKSPAPTATQAAPTPATQSELTDAEEIRTDRPGGQELLQVFQAGQPKGWSKEKLNAYVIGYLASEKVDTTSKAGILDGWTWKHFETMVRHLTTTEPS